MVSVSSADESLRLCVFDLRRGQTEGQELDKILFFYPPELDLSTQLSVTGLSEGLITFTRLFSPEAACEVIEAERHSHIFYEAESDIWMVMVVEKNKETGAIWRIDALRRVLKEVHSLFVMFHGSIRALIQKEPTGELTRSQLYPFISDYLSNLFVGKKLQLPTFRETLRERGTVQMLTLARDTALEVQVYFSKLFGLIYYTHNILVCDKHFLDIQSLVQVLDSCAGSFRCHSMILFEDLLVSTTVPADDTVNLFTFAVMRLTSKALSSDGSSWSYVRKGPGVSEISYKSTLAPFGSIDSLPSGNGNNMHHVIRPLQDDKWKKGKDGFLITDIWGLETGGSPDSAIPTIWLQQTQERVYLLAYQYKSLTLLLLMPINAIVNGDLNVSAVKQKVIEDASLRIWKIEEKISKGWVGKNAYHIKGYRYLVVDNDMEVSRASPTGKVATLAKESLLALNKLREEVDLEKNRVKRQEKDIEICIRAKNNAWVIARLTRGKELYMALEKGSNTLLETTDTVGRFSNRYCSGAFLMD
ncbi:vacuolar fusion protein CCZ1 homolog A isoform X2 [Capsella rubella]|uniref:vacuolar fusion protein CCZ1 homolog A isoform X2 n=1 Tax=Capsella rubella TaxID=81985 RepID=UPI000CD4BFBE|nr:vacuolar fusion protein CCZ1 homolog A isoform X2 [Capsella rubella]